MMVADLWGPVDHAAIGGYKYVSGSICYLSGYHMAELLRTKDEAPSAWKRMLLRIRTSRKRDLGINPSHTYVDIQS